MRPNTRIILCVSCGKMPSVNKPKRPSSKPPPLDEDLILEWADAYFKRTGAWPKHKSGHIPESVAYWRTWHTGPLDSVRGDTWLAVNAALYNGGRGLLPGSSLPILLEDRRGVLNIRTPPPLTEELILEWANAHFKRTGSWPHGQSGVIPESVEYWRSVRPSLPEDIRGDTWATVSAALDRARRGISQKMSLPILLEQRLGVFNINLPPDLTCDLVLEWVDAHFLRTGSWPNRYSGSIPESEALWARKTPVQPFKSHWDIWQNIDADLRNGGRGLEPAGSLSQFLEAHRGVIRTSPDLTEDLILEWADAHFNRTGTWPDSDAGHIPESVEYWRMRYPEAPGDVRGDKWGTIDTALIEGSRGLAPHSSLPNLLERRRGVLSLGSPPNLTEELILEWADAYFARKGSWPTAKSGSIPESEALWASKTTVAVFKSRCDHWSVVNTALRKGGRGLKSSTGLLHLLQQRRNVRNPLNLPGLELQQILLWAHQHHARTGRWPDSKSGPIPGSFGETWWTVDSVLKKGSRGLSGSSSLTGLLANNGLLNSRPSGMSFDEGLILEWADSHHARHGVWPQESSGQIPESEGATWRQVDSSLRLGRHGLPGGSSLSKLLERCRGKRSHANPLRLTEELILSWADDHNKRHGRYPIQDSGTIDAAHDETWVIVDTALRNGLRGLPPGSSLSKLLAARRGIVLRHTDPLTAEQILGWADDHNARHGRYPNSESGPILAAPGRTWMQIHEALRRGRCGFPGGSDLSAFLHGHSRDTSRANCPDLTQEQVLSWAQAFFERRGSWPTRRSGAIEGSQGDDWSAIDRALKKGARGLPQGSSLSAFLSKNGEVCL